MPPVTNWLSFSLSPMDMLRPSQASADHHQSQFMSYEGSSPNHYFDNIYPNGWAANSKVVETAAGIGCEPLMLSSFINPSEIHSQSNNAPKLEDFLGDNSCQTEATQDDSSLTNIYDNHHHAGTGISYFNRDAHDLKVLAGFQAFSTNSSSEVDDTSSAVRAQQQLAGDFVANGHSIDTARSERRLGFVSDGCGGASNGLSLGVSNLTNKMDNNTANNSSSCDSYRASQVSMDKAMVVVPGVDDSDCTKKVVDTFGQRTSIYRGVTRHRWTGRYEAHLWDNSCRREGQARKGRQVYLGGYDKEEKAARAYDLAALKYWGPTATTNFPVSNYSKELEEMKYVSKQEFIASLRRKSSGFSRGASIYRGVTRHHQQGRWQARIGRVAGNKDLYLGTFATEEEAAEAYDIAAIKFRGLNAVTNFEMNRYDVEAIIKSALPIGGAAKRLKLAIEPDQKPHPSLDQPHASSNISFSGLPSMSTIPCGVPFDSSSTLYHHGLFPHYQASSYGSGVEASGGPLTMNSQMGIIPASASEFFLWPPHQSY